MDLVVGASILIALCILIGGVLWLKEDLAAGKTVSYTVLFPNVGSLQRGDPVMINGVFRGKVGAIYLRHAQVAAVIGIDRGDTLTDSSQVTVQNIGLLGERGIGIQLHKGGVPYKPTSKKDTTFLRGNFDTGIAEAMGMMGTVLAEADVLIKDVFSIMNATIGDTAFLRLFPTIVKRLDTLVAVTENLISRNGPVVDEAVRNVSKASGQLKELLDRNGGRIDTVLANGAALSSYSLELATKVESLATSIQTIVHDIESGKGALGMLLKDEQFSKDLKRTVAEVDTLLNDVQNDALKLRVKYGFGKKKK